MGAGLSGLACAITLEQHGVTPHVYENRSRVGDRFVSAEVLFSFISRPVKDCIEYLSEQFHLYLQPLASVQNLLIYSPNAAASIDGYLGFTNLRGREQESFEAQLSRQLKTPITLNSQKSYEQLLREYTHIVMATGDADYGVKTNNFRKDFTVCIKGAMVEGSFDRNTVRAWLNYDASPGGYGYLIPISEQKANIVIAYSEHRTGVVRQMEPSWDLFKGLVEKELGQTLRVTDHFEISQYAVGICNEGRIGNTFFVGNCFGCIMPYLGFGQFASILTGVYAAYDLLGLGKYEELTAAIRQSYENSLVLRRSMEQLTNKDLDLVVGFLDGYWGDKLLKTSRFDPFKVASYLLRPYVKLKVGATS